MWLVWKTGRPVIPFWVYPFSVLVVAAALWFCFLVAGRPLFR